MSNINQTRALILGLAGGDWGDSLYRVRQPQTELRAPPRCQSPLCMYMGLKEGGGPPLVTCCLATPPSAAVLLSLLCCRMWTLPFS